MMPGVVVKTRNAVSRLPASGAWLRVKRTWSRSGHDRAAMMSASGWETAQGDIWRRTCAVGILSGKLSNSIADLVADPFLRLDYQSLQELCADGGALFLV